MKKLVCVFLAVLLVVGVFAGCGGQESVEKRVSKDCESMMLALRNQDTEAVKKLLHPMTVEEQGIGQSVQTLLQVMENKQVKSVLFDAPEITEREAGEWLVKGTGTATLADGKQLAIQYNYLSDGDDGFLKFIVKEITE